MRGCRHFSSLSRRPVHAAAAQEMDVQVEDGLARTALVLTTVRYPSVTIPSWRATSAANSIMSPSSPGSRASSSVATCSRGTISTCVGACGLMSRNATHRASRPRSSPGSPRARCGRTDSHLAWIPRRARAAARSPALRWRPSRTRRIVAPSVAGTKPASVSAARSLFSIPPSGPIASVTGSRKERPSSGGPVRSSRMRGPSGAAASARSSGASGKIAGRRAPRSARAPRSSAARTRSAKVGPSPRGFTLRDRRHTTGRQLAAPSSVHFSASHSIRSRSAIGTRRWTDGGTGSASMPVTSTVTRIPNQPEQRGRGAVARAIHQTHGRAGPEPQHPGMTRNAFP